jgi:ribosomal protein S18 acetylase RimI-like enzyme
MPECGVAAERAPLVYRAPGELTVDERGQLDEFLAAVSSDFIPPLDRRTSPTQTSFEEAAGVTDGAYARALVRQHNILGYATDRKLVGLLSFQAPLIHPRFLAEDACTYVSTVAVDREHRREGVARELYETLFSLTESLPSLPEWILLRTWSANTGHLKLLETLGFQLLMQLPDDRGPALDTLYLGRRPAACSPGKAAKNS